MSKITIIEGNSNDKDNVRVLVAKGEKGSTITSIEKTATTGLVDTYTITLNDGSTQDFTVTNGEDGTDGADGISPVATVTKLNSVATISITDRNGTTTANVSDGAPGYEVPAGSVIGWDSSNAIPGGYVEVDNPDNYSTTETVIGTWINGEPLYRKVQSVTISNHSAWTSLVTITDLEKVINIRAVKDDGEVILPRYEGSDYNANFLIDGTTVKYKCQGLAGTYDLIVEYTKTTE